MMTEIFNAFKGQSSSAPSRSVPTTLAITEGENEDMKTEKEDIGDEKADNEQESVRETRAIPISTIKLTNIVLEILTPKDGVEIEVIGSSRPQPTETPSEVAQAQPTMIVITPPSQPESSRATPITDTGKEKSELIKVVREEASKARIDPKTLESAKVKAMKLRKKRIDNYMWTTTTRLKSEPINDVKIHPNSKPAVITVYRDTDRRNFKVHNPFKFGDFRITELDELGPIIQKKKDKIVAPEQGSSQLFKRKIRRILDHELRIPTLECNMSLLEGVSFVNNMVIDEPEYGMFFIDIW
ncbi:hypothetical protein Tco_1259321 [Tanacetum coccineum]